MAEPLSTIWERAAARAAGERAETPAGTPERATLAQVASALEALPRLAAARPRRRDARALREGLLARVVGLDAAVRRILERLVLHDALDEGGGAAMPALLLEGPPGSGKRALVRAIAAASGRPLAHVPAPAAGDPGLAGHPRASGGRAPGALLSALLESGTLAPVLWLEAADRREHEGALAALLDPARRGAFEDRFLGVPLDLSRAIVVLSARRVAALPPALLRHAEVVRLPGFGRGEKLEVLRRALLPRAVALCGEAGRGVEVTDAALERLAAEYAPEAGVHGLARRIEEVARRASAASLLGEAPAARVDAADLPRLIGPPPAEAHPRRRAEVGAALGLVWGPEGAEAAPVEAIRDDSVGAGRGAGAWRAAAEAALAYVASRAERLRAAPGALRDGGFRLRVGGPAPLADDDGADLAILLALVSLATDRPVRPDVALAGALTIRGAVRATAGVPEKVLAAARAGARRVLIPAADFAGLASALSPQSLSEVEVVPVAHADDAVREALIDIVIARELR